MDHLGRWFLVIAVMTLLHWVSRFLVWRARFLVWHNRSDSRVPSFLNRPLWAQQKEHPDA